MDPRRSWSPLKLKRLALKLLVARLRDGPCGFCGANAGDN
jgi:hypothetical protein